MKIKTYLYSDNSWNEELDKNLDSQNTIVIVFGSINLEKIYNGLKDLFNIYRDSTIIGCSSGGEIYGSEVYDDTISVAVSYFEKSSFKLISREAKEDESFEIGQSISSELEVEDLKSIFILSNVLGVNGSELMRGVNISIAESCAVSGGLAGDGVEFNKTWLLVDNNLVDNYVCVVGFYGKDLHVNYGCKCGWRRFGIDRKVTHSVDNVLYTLDNKPALELYKRYLGEYASSLPASALYFPLMIHSDGKKEAKFRAIKAIDEQNNSIVLAGSIPQNSIVSFAIANFDEIISSAEEAAMQLKDGYDNQEALCLGISCVARRVVLKQQTEDELEVVVDTLGKNVSMVGFYSFGEFSRSKNDGCCDFHNQTMALSLMYES